MSQGAAQGSRQSISLLNKSQNVSNHNISGQEPSFLVSSSSRARSSNKSATGQKNNQANGQTLTPSSPWTPERSTILVKSTSQIQKKSIFSGMNTMNGQRRVIVDTSPEPTNTSTHMLPSQQKSSTSIQAQLNQTSYSNNTTAGGGNSKVNTSSLSAKPAASRQNLGGTTVTLKQSSGPIVQNNSQTQASHRSSSASFIKQSTLGGQHSQTPSGQSASHH